MKKALSIATLFVMGSIMMSASCRHGGGCAAYGNKMRAEKAADQSEQVMAIQEKEEASSTHLEVEG